MAGHKISHAAQDNLELSKESISIFNRKWTGSYLKVQCLMFQGLAKMLQGHYIWVPFILNGGTIAVSFDYHSILNVYSMSALFPCHSMQSAQYFYRLLRTNAT